MSEKKTVKMKLSKEKLLNDSEYLKSAIDKGAKVGVKIKFLNTRKALEVYADVIREALESSKEYKDYRKERDEILKKHYKTDPSGNLILFSEEDGKGKRLFHGRGFPIYKNKDKMETELEEFDKKNEKLINSQKDLEIQSIEELKKDIEIEIPEKVELNSEEIGEPNANELETIDRYFNLK